MEREFSPNEQDGGGSLCGPSKRGTIEREKGNYRRIQKRNGGLEAKSDSRKRRTPEEAQKMKNRRRKEREIRERGKKPKLGMQGKSSEIRGERNGRERIYLKDYTISSEMRGD